MHLLLMMEPRQWYETLNRKVFFWLSPERLDDRLSTDEVCERLADRLTEQGVTPVFLVP